MSTPEKSEYDRVRYRGKKTRREAARTPDPIENITEIDRAYIAGLIDGEGSIYCGAVGPHRLKTCYPMIAIGMTDRGVLLWLAGLLGCSISYVLKRTKNPKWKDQYFVRLSGKRAQLFCRALLPYLRVKRPQAELVCTFPCDARRAPGEKIEFSDINSERFRLRDLINGMNHRPRNPNTRRGRA